jgi:hypothetical protein
MKGRPRGLKLAWETKDVPLLHVRTTFIPIDGIMSPPPPSSINFSFQPPTVLQELSRSRGRGGAPSLVLNDDGDDDCRNSCKGPMESHFRARHIDFPPLTETPRLNIVAPRDYGRPASSSAGRV